jgi:hypothetical protein
MPRGRKGERRPADVIGNAVQVMRVAIELRHDRSCRSRRSAVANDASELDQMQKAYKAAVEEWITAISQEEDLASVNHSIAEVDKWEQAHFAEEEVRSKVKAAKKRYEDALREKIFNF